MADQAPKPPYRPLTERKWEAVRAAATLALDGGITPPPLPPPPVPPEGPDPVSAVKSALVESLVGALRGGIDPSLAQAAVAAACASWDERTLGIRRAPPRPRRTTSRAAPRGRVFSST